MLQCWLAKVKFAVSGGGTSKKKVQLRLWLRRGNFRLAVAGGTAHQRGSPARQAAFGDFVQVVDPRGTLVQRLGHRACFSFRHDRSFLHSAFAE